jgi:hypothetical protein
MEKSSPPHDSPNLRDKELGKDEPRASDEPFIDPDVEDHTALQRGLKSRHITMIAIGGAIGTGLIIGTGVALARAGFVTYPFVNYEDRIKIDFKTNIWLSLDPARSCSRMHLWDSLYTWSCAVSARWQHGFQTERTSLAMPRDFVTRPLDLLLDT